MINNYTFLASDLSVFTNVEIQIAILSHLLSHRNMKTTLHFCNKNTRRFNGHLYERLNIIETDNNCTFT